MRFRLWRRRLTVSAPRMSVRSALPWPIRSLVVALVLGFSAAVGLWAFEQGKQLAGFDDKAKEELIALRQEAIKLRANLESSQSVINTSQSQIIAEQTSQRELALQLKRLELENQSLRSDLNFFELLIGAAQLKVRMQRDAVIALHEGIQKLMHADTFTPVEPLVEIIPLHHACNGVFGR